MAVFTITTFSTFAGLLVAGHKLATDPNPVNWIKALADLASNGKALSAALKDNGLTPLAAEMTRVAEETALNFTHPGPARDDAIALFWQVAPDAFSDPAIFAAANLDATVATDRMVTAIRRSPYARDFFATGLPESLFRQITHRALSAMLAKSDYIACITPDLWRETLRRHGIEIILLTELSATAGRTEGKIDELNARITELTAQLATSKEAQIARDSGVSERALIRLVRPIAEDVEDTAQALIELTRAVEIAAKVQREGRHGSNLGDFVDEVLRRTAALSAQGEHRAAISELDEALLRVEAEFQARTLRLLTLKTDEHLLARDPVGAANSILERIRRETTEPSGISDALRQEWRVWFERGRDYHIRLDLEVAVALAALASSLDDNPEPQSTIESGASRLHLARAIRLETTRRISSSLFSANDQASAHGDDLSEVIRLLKTAIEDFGRVPSLPEAHYGSGMALYELGLLGHGTENLKAAVIEFQKAVSHTKPEQWRFLADVHDSLGTAQLQIDEREPEVARLEGAVDAFSVSLGSLSGFLEQRIGVRKGIHELRQKHSEWEGRTLKEQMQWLKLKREKIILYIEAFYLEADAIKLFGSIEKSRINCERARVKLGRALYLLGERRDGFERLEQAVDAFQTSIRVFEASSEKYDLADANEHLKKAMALLLARRG